ncbi:MAG: hypothetical protein MMC33_005810 [Icmadophila ericetorum]|nr:hypothetical protein [Icmadophila ericetorum]
MRQTRNFVLSCLQIRNYGTKAEPRISFPPDKQSRPIPSQSTPSRLNQLRPIRGPYPSRPRQKPLKDQRQRIGREYFLAPLHKWQVSAIKRDLEDQRRQGSLVDLHIIGLMESSAGTDGDKSFMGETEAEMTHKEVAERSQRFQQIVSGNWIGNPKVKKIPSFDGRGPVTKKYIKWEIEGLSATHASFIRRDLRQLLASKFPVYDTNFSHPWSSESNNGGTNGGSAEGTRSVPRKNPEFDKLDTGGGDVSQPVAKMAPEVKKTKFLLKVSENEARLAESMVRDLLISTVYKYIQWIVAKELRSSKIRKVEDKSPFVQLYNNSPLLTTRPTKRPGLPIDADALSKILDVLISEIRKFRPLLRIMRLRFKPRINKFNKTITVSGISPRVTKYIPAEDGVKYNLIHRPSSLEEKSLVPHPPELFSIPVSRFLARKLYRSQRERRRNHYQARCALAEPKNSERESQSSVNPGSLVRRITNVSPSANVPLTVEELVDDMLRLSDLYEDPSLSLSSGQQK